MQIILQNTEAQFMQKHKISLMLQHVARVNINMFNVLINLYCYIFLFLV